MLSDIFINCDSGNGLLPPGCQGIAKLLSFGSLWTNITETWIKLQNVVSDTSLTHIFSRKNADGSYIYGGIEPIVDI